MTDNPIEVTYTGGAIADVTRRERDELRAECDQWQKKVAELWAERERINAEFREQIQVEHAAYQELLAQANRTATIYEKEIDKLRAENERLRVEVADLLPGMDADAMTISNLAREIERLRAALEKHHDLLSDEPGDVCRTCALDYLGRDTE